MRFAAFETLSSVVSSFNLKVSYFCSRHSIRCYIMIKPLSYIVTISVHVNLRYQKFYVIECASAKEVTLSAI